MSAEPSPRVHAALNELMRAELDLGDARAELHAAILADLAVGVRQADLARATGYSRERIRQLTREAEARASA